jgi:cell division septum initiation protein DivIVA
VPEEVEQARRVVRDGDAVVEAARQEAERITSKARDEGERMAASHQFVVDAQRQAKAIIQEARQKADRLQSDADDYVFNALSQLQAELTRQIRVVENGLQRLEAEREAAIAEKRV